MGPDSFLQDFSRGRVPCLRRATSSIWSTVTDSQAAPAFRLSRGEWLLNDQEDTEANGKEKGVQREARCGGAQQPGPNHASLWRAHEEREHQVLLISPNLHPR